MNRVAWATALLALVCGCSKAEPPSYSGTREIPTLRLEVEDGISAVDFACDGDSVLHVAFLAEMRDSAKAGRGLVHLWYERGDLAAGTWSEPRHLGEVERGSVRVVRVGPDVHVIAPGHLRDFASRDDGNTWRELTPLLGEEDYSWQFDAGALGNSLLVVFLVHVSRDSLTVATLETDFKSRRTSGIALVKDDTWISNPRIVLGAGRADLFFGTSEKTRDTTTVEGQRRISTHYRPRAFHALREATGRWNTEEIGPLLRQRTGAYSGPPTAIEELDATRSQGRWLVFWVNAALYATSQRADGSWTEGVLVAPQSEGVLNRSYVVRSLGCDGDSDGVVAWVDTRYVKTGGFLINPFGGLPGAHSNWASTDALALRIREAPGHEAEKPLRLTSPSAYVEQLRVRAGVSKSFVLWSGRRKVGNRFTDYGAPPTLFYASVPKR